jgi:capsular exopolysaccharide synthesis family protein
MIDKKVILIDGDLRRSKLHKTFKVKNINGLSTYLSNQANLEEIIVKTGFENVDFIPAGISPPNPAELLFSDRMANLLDELRGRYDFILIDTAPIGLVSDAISLVRLSDVKIFVLRAGVSGYNAATIPERVSKEYGLSNVVIVLNSYTEDPLHSRYYSTNYSSGYGGGYYYTTYGSKSSEYYTDEGRSSKWWKFWN